VGAWTEPRGDWKFLKEALHLEQSYATNYICHLRRAHRHISRLLYTRFSRGARHRQTIVDPDAWLRAALAATHVSPLILLVGFCVFHVYFDIMHVVDLGVHQSNVPSALWELTETESVWPGITRQQRFLAAYRDYRAWAKGRRVKAVARQPFQVKQWRKSATSYPRITQKVAKAATLRSMIYWVAHVCDRVAGRDQHSLIRANMFKFHVQADVCLRRADRALTASERKELALAVEGALLCNNWLAAQTLGQRLYTLLPKHHALSHIGYDAVVNPRRTMCYADEDMVGRCKKIYNRCHGETAAARCVQRYSLLVACRWWEHLRVLRNISLNT
jgi:hypothetical protein